MEPHSKWLTSNIASRFANPRSNFKLIFKPRKVNITSFDKAVHLAVVEIAQQAKDAGQQIGIALSGGADSEFVLEAFRDRCVTVRPYIVDTPYYRYEVAYAFRLVREYDLDPIVLRPSDQLLVGVFFHKIVNPFNSMGPGSIPLMLAAEVAKSRNTLLIHGQHFLNDDDNDTDNIFELYSPEQDWYQDGLYPNNTKGFFVHSPELIYAMVKELRKDEEAADYKARIFKTPWRPKIRPAFTFAMTKQLARPDDGTIERDAILPPKDEFLSMLEGWQ